MESCKDCPCLCKPITNKCIQMYSSITDACVLGTDDFAKASDDIDDLIGMDCAEQLCEALKKASEDAELNGNSIKDNLAKIWLDIIGNRHFKSWYANRLLFHWAFGASISQIEQQGLITISNSDSEYNKNFEHATEAERKRIQESAKHYANKSRRKFIDHFWLHNLDRYPCYELECGCTKLKKCEVHCPPRNRVKMCIV